MSLNTINQNKHRQNLHEFDEIWLFGYGSLIYKVDFPYLEKVPATIKGWQRKFWQGSDDHRGTPQNPGRVVTLIPSKSNECVGMAFKITHDVFDHLDHREKNGYLRYEIDIYLDSLSQEGKKPPKCIKGIVYIASEDNEAFLGYATELNIARHINQSSGPSGHNRDYVFQLADALKALGDKDAHVFAIERYLKELSQIDQTLDSPI